MAPIAKISREQVLGALRSLFPKRHVPMTLGSGSPESVIDYADGEWLWFRLEMDHKAAELAGEEALARGESWMPEMTWRFLTRGEVLCRAKTAKELADLLEAREDF